MRDQRRDLVGIGVRKHAVAKVEHEGSARQGLHDPLGLAPRLGPADQQRHRVEVALEADLRQLAADAGDRRRGIEAQAVERDGIDGTITWAGGGHPPPLLAGGSGDGEFRRLEPQAPMLGVISPSEYVASSQTVPLRSGEKLIAYTDGANEAADAAGRQLQVEGLERMVHDVLRRQPEDLPGQILQRVSEYRRGPAADDTLIVVIQPG